MEMEMQKIKNDIKRAIIIKCITEGISFNDYFKRVSCEQTLEKRMNDYMKNLDETQIMTHLCSSHSEVHS